jgi:DHA1 family tetracycline resistance protein-like MFS transporter
MKLFTLLFTVLIDSLGFGLIFPLLSPLVMSGDGGVLSEGASLAARGLVFGVLISAFCAGQFLGSPFLGALSDRLGRKKVLLFAIALGALSYLLSAGAVMIHSIFFLLLGRFLAGVSAGNYAVVQSVVADSISEEERAKNFGLINMAWGLGFIIGPFVGVKLTHLFSEMNMLMPFLFAALRCGVNALFVSWKLSETLQARQSEPLTLWIAGQRVKRAFQIRELRGVFVAIFIFSFGWGFFTEFSPLFLIRTFNFGVDEIGSFYAFVGVCVALCQGLLIRPFLKRFTAQQLFLGALLGLSGVLGLLLFVRTPLLFFCMMPIVALPEALIGPTSSSIVSKLAGQQNQGEVLGMYNSVQWAGIGIAPLFAGSLVALYPHLPMSVASVCMLGAFLAFFWFLKRRGFAAIS